MAKVIEIPTGTTNLEAIKKVFPDCDIEDVGFDEYMILINHVSIEDFRLIVSKEWAESEYR
jgi:hypothetical protein